MGDLHISEAGSVQFPMIRHAVEIGWTPVPPEAAKRKRGGETGTLFRQALEAALGQPNSWITWDAMRAIIERLEALPPDDRG